MPKEQLAGHPILETVLFIMNPLPPDEENLGKTVRIAQKDYPSPSMGEGFGEGEKTIGPSFYRGAGSSEPLSPAASSLLSKWRKAKGCMGLT
jgi:hypothetical protein